jgi:hypothetical protein
MPEHAHAAGISKPQDWQAAAELAYLSTLPAEHPYQYQYGPNRALNSGFEGRCSCAMMLGIVVQTVAPSKPSA